MGGAVRGSSEGEQKRRGGGRSRTSCALCRGLRVCNGIAIAGWLSSLPERATSRGTPERAWVLFLRCRGTCRIRVSLCLAAYYGRTPELSRGDRRCFSCRVFCLPRETRRWPRCFFSAFLRLGFVPVVLESVCLFSRGFFMLVCWVTV